MIKLGIIGDVLVDYTLMQTGEDKLRHGGIMHAARGAFALNMDYTIFHFAPSYLEKSVSDFAASHNGKIVSIGTVDGSPNVILIKEAKETGHQGYEMLLREAKNYNYQSLHSSTVEDTFSDFLVFTGGYELQKVLKYLSKSRTKVHIDISNDLNDLESLKDLERKFTTVYISTSSDLFSKYASGDVNNLIEFLKPYSESVVFKENRGGSRYFDFISSPLLISSQTKPIVHSVGVGDNFDVAHIWAVETYAQVDALTFASWVAAEYASTTFIDDYKRGVQRIVKSGISALKECKGTSLPWEERKAINVYIAAPDFDYVNRKYINELRDSLSYHNFSPRLPIREHGQLQLESSVKEKSTICKKDIELLCNCQLVVAVLLYEDPGTLIELGYAIAKGIPAFVYDPFKKANNCILEYLPTLVSNNLDEIITAIFKNSSK